MGEGVFMENKGTGLAELLGNPNLLPKCSAEVATMLMDCAYGTCSLKYEDAKKLLMEIANIIHFDGELVVEDWLWENQGYWHPILYGDLSSEVRVFIKNFNRNRVPVSA